MEAKMRRSTLPGAGRGLFADRRYARGEHVAYYTGTYTDHPIEGDRVLEITSQLSIDGGGRCRSKNRVI